MSAAMAYMPIESVDVERELRVAVTKLTRPFRNDFQFAVYESDRQILHGKCWSLNWSNNRAIIM